MTPLSFTGPVTALHWIHTARPQIQSDRYLLSGSGGTLSLIDLQASPMLQSRVRVVNKDRIHVIASLPGHEDVLLGAGRQVARAILDLDTLSISVKCTRLLDDFVLAASFYQDSQGRTFALVATARHSVHLLDLASDTLEPVHKVDCDNRPFFWSAAFSQPLYSRLQDVRLASGSVWAEVLVWRPFKSRHLEMKLSGHNGTIFGVAFSPSGSSIASCSDDNTVRLWSLYSPSQPPQTFWGHQARVWRVCWMDDDTLLSSGEDAKILIWSKIEGKQVGGWHGAHDGKSIWTLGVQREQGIVASGGADGQVRLLKRTRVSTISTVLDVQSKAVAASEDGQAVAAVDRAGVLHVFMNGEHSHSLQLPPAFKEGCVLAMGTQDNSVLAVNARGTACSILTGASSSEDPTTFDLGHIVSQIHVQVIDNFGQAETRLVTSDRKLRQVNVSRLGEAEQPQYWATASADQVASMRLTPDRCRLIVGNAEGRLSIFSCDTTSQLLHSSRAHQDAITDLLCLNEDIFISVSRDCTWATHRIEKDGSLTTLSRCCLRDGARIEKVLWNHGQLYFLCASRSQFRVLNQSGDELAAKFYNSATVPQNCFGASDFGLTVTWQFKRGIHTLCVSLVAEGRFVTSGPTVGQEVLDVKLFRYDSHLLLLAATTEDGAIHIASVSPSGTLHALYADRSLHSTIKTLHWVKSNDVLYLIGTGSRYSRVVYKVNVYNHPALDKRTVGAVMVSQSCSQEGSEDELRIVDSLVHLETTSDQVQLVSGCSDGSLRVDKMRLSDLEWTSVQHSSPTRKCTLSLASAPASTGLGLVFQGATDGRITIWRPETQSESLRVPLDCFQIHQSGINSLAVTSRGEADIVVISGGDDGQLYASVFEVHQGLIFLKAKSQATTAHSSAVRGIRALDESTFISASWDQRLAVWKLTGQGLELQQRTISDIADINAVECCISESAAGAGWLVVVAGVGLQVLALTECTGGDE